MRKGKKIWLIAAGISVIVGMMMVAGALVAAGFDLSTVSFKDSEVTVTEAFDSIAFDLEVADITINPSDDKQCRVLFHEWETQPFTAEVRDRTLHIGSKYKRSWLDSFSFNFKKPTVTLYLPEKTYQSLTVHSVTGSVRLSEALRIKDVAVKSVTSDVTCEAAVSDTVTVQVVTGDVRLHGAAPKTIQLETTTGNVSLDRCDAQSITVHTVTGNITGTLLTGKTFHASTTTGRVAVPNDAPGGTCELTATTGNIRMELIK